VLTYSIDFARAREQSRKIFMPIKLTAADKTDRGRQREQNEDKVFKRVESSDEGDYGLFIVADGMGGYQAGEVASKLAVEKISKTLGIFFEPISEQPTVKLQLEPETPADPDATLRINTRRAVDHAQQTIKLPETASLLTDEQRIRDAIQSANDEIIHYGEQHPSARGLGSTLTMALVLNDRAYIANIGDSRTYLMHHGRLERITRDHSLVEKLVETKQIAPDEIYTHPQRNVIYRSLGAGRKKVEVDIFPITLEPGDTLLLCCDGLWEMVRKPELERELKAKHGPQGICDRLIELANENGGEDNISAIVVQASAH
jgi:PPM family protein phosphatase